MASKLEIKCEWKKAAEREFQLEGSLAYCNLCDGYKTTCEDYYVTKNSTRRLKREYKKWNIVLLI